MKQLVLRNTIILILLVFVFAMCSKTEEYSNIPEIHFKQFTLRDTLDDLQNSIHKATLYFSFVDGDGDLGLAEGDTFPPFTCDTCPYYYNVFMKVFEKVDTGYQEIIQPISTNYRFRYLEVGQNTTIKGTMDIKIDYTPLSFPYDTIRYEFYIVDRAMHHSNIVVTPDLILNQGDTIIKQ